MSVPRIVIGGARPLRIPALVCEYTIKKHCPEAEVIQTYTRPFIKDGDPKLVRDRWEDPCEWVRISKATGTCFSFCRTMVPEICGFEGRAIYMDADKIVFDDISEVWNLPMKGAKVLRLIGGQYSVLVCDNEGMEDYRIGKLLETGVQYRDILNGRYYPRGMVRGVIPGEWNTLDKYLPGKTKLIHYTRMWTQPWYVDDHRFGDVWYEALAEAVREGFLSREAVAEDIRDEKAAWIAARWPQPHVLAELDKRL